MKGRRPLVLVPEHFGSLVFDRRTARYLPFDHDATALLRRLALAPIDPGPDADFVRHFEAHGFFDLSGRFAADLLDADPPMDHLLGPLAVHLEVAARCNLACAHCFASPLPRPGEALSLAELEPLFAELASLGSYRLGVTGGEPLLRPDLLELLDLALAAGLRPCVTTNALLVDEHVARELGRRDLVWLNVSLDGPDAESNDAIRGPGTFERVLERLSILRRHARFSIAFTVTAGTAAQAQACARLARDVGAEAAVFRPLYPVGSARSRPELSPSLQAYAQAVDGLSKLAGDDALLVATDPFGPRAREPGAARVYSNSGCGAANVVASVSAAGEVSPCSFLGPAFVAGNVRDTSFRSLWDDGPAFRRLREPQGAFRGGCRARALAAHGSAEAVDPWQESLHA